VVVDCCLQVIQNSGTNGIWTKDIKTQTGLQQQPVTKALKVLEQQKNLVKSLKAVHSKSKKLYMLTELGE
jgi:DNA-directed RNA polymerase III subunit RPC6